MLDRLCQQINNIIDSINLIVRAVAQLRRDVERLKRRPGAGELQAKYVLLPEVDTATYNDLQDYFNTVISSGYTTGGTITDNGDGTVAVAAGTGYIRADSSTISELKAFDFAADASVSLTDAKLNLVYVDYNGGTPSIANAITFVTLDFTSQFPLGMVFRDGTTLYISQVGQNLNDFIHKAYDERWQTYDFRLAPATVGKVTDTIAIAESGTRSIASDGGTAYWGYVANTIAAIDSDKGDTFTYAYQDGVGGWTEVTASTQINNTQYDDGDGTLGTLTAGNYGVHWVYATVIGSASGGKGWYVVYGQGDYTLAGALAASAPTDLPDVLNAVGILLAKIIILKSAASFYSITYPWFCNKGSSVPTDHGSFGGLSDDSHTQYFLLAGRSGGQTGIGGTGASDNLTLKSTSNATKGKVIFGNAATSVFDEVNNRWGLGTATPQVPFHFWVGDAGTDPTWTSADKIIFESDVNFAYEFFTPNTRTVTIAFSDPDARAAGYFQYQHSGDAFAFVPGGTTMLSITASATKTNDLWARTAAGLTLADDAGNLGVFIEDATGNVGVKTSSPLGSLHVVDTYGYRMFTTVSIPDGSAVTVIPNGTGDVANVALVNFTIVPSSGTPNANQVAVLPSGSANIFSSGADLVYVQVAADGTMTVQRTGGTLTYTAALDIVWQ